MKAISGAIIVLSGAILFSVGSLARGDAQSVTWVFGGMLVFFGLYGWFLACVRDSNPVALPRVGRRRSRPHTRWLMAPV